MTNIELDIDRFLRSNFHAFYEHRNSVETVRNAMEFKEIP